MKTFTIVSVNTSAVKGVAKKPARTITLVEGMGVEGDAHAGPGKRQVSLLGREDIERMAASGVVVDNGDFAENITTRDVDLAALPIGTRLTIGRAVLEITQIGKECHRGCAIMRQTGSCAMPKRGVFARVVCGGEVRDGDTGTYDI